MSALHTGYTDRWNMLCKGTMMITCCLVDLSSITSRKQRGRVCKLAKDGKMNEGKPYRLMSTRNRTPNFKTTAEKSGTCQCNSESSELERQK